MRTIEREFVQGAFVQVFCTRPIKNLEGGSEMCDVLWRFCGVPGCVTKCDRGEGGSKLAKNSVMYFMDGPLWYIGACTSRSLVLFLPHLCFLIEPFRHSHHCWVKVRSFTNFTSSEVLGVGSFNTVVSNNLNSPQCNTFCITSNQSFESR